MTKEWIAALAAGGIVLAAPGVYADEVVGMDELPAPVRETIQHEVGRGQIEGIQREQEGGNTVYQAECVEDGRRVELEVAEDGRLLDREVD